MKLSEGRVLAVKDYLVAQGIDGGRITTVAFGSTQPIASNDYEWNRKKNRRVEMKILTF
jgi:outer membrane protein OmpA-like peptidoglycan-associated protein